MKLNEKQIQLFKEGHCAVEMDNFEATNEILKACGHEKDAVLAFEMFNYMAWCPAFIRPLFEDKKPKHVPIYNASEFVVKDHKYQQGERVRLKHDEFENVKTGFFVCEVKYPGLAECAMTPNLNYFMIKIAGQFLTVNEYQIEPLR